MQHQRMNNFIICSECEKPRVLHTARKLHFDDVVKLKSKLEMLLCACGYSLQELGPDTVMSRMYVHANLICSDPINIPYYSSDSSLEVCTNCSTSSNITAGEQGVYPTCSDCITQHNYCKRKGKLKSGKSAKK